MKYPKLYSIYLRRTIGQGYSFLYRWGFSISRARLAELRLTNMEPGTNSVRKEGSLFSGSVLVWESVETGD